MFIIEEEREAVEIFKNALMRGGDSPPSDDTILFLIRLMVGDWYFPDGWRPFPLAPDGLERYWINALEPQEYSGVFPIYSFREAASLSTTVVWNLINSIPLHDELVYELDSFRYRRIETSGVTLSGEVASWSTTSLTQDSTISYPDLVGVPPPRTEARAESNVDTLLERPESHGVNDLAHNLNIMYQHTYALYKDNLVYVRGFFNTTSNRNQDNKIKMEYSIKDKTEVREYNEGSLVFLFPKLGWVPHGADYYYFEYRYGGFLRSISWKNIVCTAAFRRKQAVLGYSLADIPEGTNIVKSVLARQYHSINETIAEGPEHIHINENSILIRVGAEGMYKYLALYLNLCVGELSKNSQHIKIYKPYAHLTKELQEVFNYETR